MAVMDEQQADCMDWWRQHLELSTCPVEPVTKYLAFLDAEPLAQPSTLTGILRFPGSGIECVFLGKGEWFVASTFLSSLSHH